MLAIIFVAALLRGWQLGDIPPGLYRDEAYNGLDALGVLAGRHAVFFEANNGREPGYIYLTALFIAAFGRNVIAVRAAAAVVGTLTTWLTYRLTADWFGRRTALLAAWFWAVTFWPVHLSRLGLRPILLPASLALTLWLAGRAYQTHPLDRRRWFVAGIAYGVTFYTYLAARFTPLFIAFILAWLLRRDGDSRLRRGLPWALLGLALGLSPLLLQAWQAPELVAGRIGQVSLLNPAVNDGDLAGTLLRQLGRTLGLFFVAGDTIARHNLPGRPFFDIPLAFAAIAGLAWCLRRWRRPAASALMAWTAVMLGPTLLAEDAPHFLRSVGILPAALIFPALGLSQLWTWPKLPGWIRHAAVVAVAASTLILTVRDLNSYGTDPATAYWFDGAARALADDINNEIDSGTATIWVDAAYWNDWPSLRFLVEETTAMRYYDRAGGPDPGAGDVIFAWPFNGLEEVTTAINALSPPVKLSVQTGALNKGDREPAPYPLYIRYALEPASTPVLPLADFAGPVRLNSAIVTYPAPDRLRVTLEWSGDAVLEDDLSVFVHVVAPAGTVAQSDGRPADGMWPTPLWQPGQIVVDVHEIDLPGGFTPSLQTIVVGLYDALTGERLPIVDSQGLPTGDAWPLAP